MAVREVKKKEPSKRAGRGRSKKVVEEKKTDQQQTPEKRKPRKAAKQATSTDSNKKVASRSRSATKKVEGPKRGAKAREKALSAIAKELKVKKDKEEKKDKEDKEEKKEKVGKAVAVVARGRPKKGSQARGKGKEEAKKPTVKRVPMLGLRKGGAGNVEKMYNDLVGM